MRPIFLTLSAAAILAMTACTSTTTDSQRAVVGAVGGAVAGEVLFDEPLAGAAIGGIAGALADDFQY